MTITLDDGQKIKVYICDAHAEDATIKSAKAAYATFKAQKDAENDEAEKLIARLKELGHTVSSGPGFVIASAPEAPKKAEKAASSAATAPKPEVILEGEDVVPTSFVDSKVMQTRGGSVSAPGLSASVSAHSSINPVHHAMIGDQGLDPSKLHGKVRLVQSHDITGNPIAVPNLRVDQLGTTLITIDNSETDAKLQRRFKNMASATMNSGYIPNFAGGHDGATRDCTLCQAKGTISRKKGTIEVCPQCKGAARVPIF
jgi:hypothetical protein